MRVFLEERDLFLRERIAGAYRTSAYFWSKSIADTPLQLLFALIFSLMSYYFVGLQMSVGHVLKYCLTIVLTTLAAESYVIMIGDTRISLGCDLSLVCVDCMPMDNDGCWAGR
jgi:hypothetical protein